jgi:catechol 2,3-dioxygenase-like lactoylglutathione lyase family enzyme
VHRVIAIDHVQLAMPRGREDDAEAFYCGLLGFERVPKPAALAARGGCWFHADGAEVHLGVEDDFRAAQKAHPALRIADLDELIADLEKAGVGVRWDDELPDVRRCYVADPFGNRIELIDEHSPAEAPK